jgi:hypothetical protein
LCRRTYPTWSLVHQQRRSSISKWPAYNRNSLAILMPELKWIETD